MYSTTHELYTYEIVYCSFKVLYDKCKWWQFIKKRVIKEQLDWYYPLMRGEVESRARMDNN